MSASTSRPSFSRLKRSILLRVMSGVGVAGLKPCATGARGAVLPQKISATMVCSSACTRARRWLDFGTARRPCGRAWVADGFVTARTTQNGFDDLRFRDAVQSQRVRSLASWPQPQDPAAQGQPGEKSRQPGSSDNGNPERRSAATTHHAPSPSTIAPTSRSCARSVSCRCPATSL